MSGLGWVETVLTSDNHFKINEKHSKISRFKGSIVRISLKGKDDVQKVIRSQFSIDNFYKLVQMLSSIICETYFYILA